MMFSIFQYYNKVQKTINFNSSEIVKKYFNLKNTLQPTVLVISITPRRLRSLYLYHHHHYHHHHHHRCFCPLVHTSSRPVLPPSSSPFSHVTSLHEKPKHPAKSERANRRKKKPKREPNLPMCALYAEVISTLYSTLHSSFFHSSPHSQLLQPTTPSKQSKLALTHCFALFARSLSRNAPSSRDASRGVRSRASLSQSLLSAVRARARSFVR